jgi:lysylphosphatidylglycerol synthetase-like protein (DUF2156 family)
MHRLSLVLFFTLLVSCVAFIVGTFEQLPPRVASHFGLAGESNAWMRRENYLLFMLGFATLLPLFLVASLAWLPRLTSRNIKVPNREYWLAPAQRGETLAALAAFGGWLGCLVAAFIAALHYTVLEANTSVPPQMRGPLLWSVVGGFIAATLAWQALFSLRFRAPR